MDSVSRPTPCGSEAAAKHRLGDGVTVVCWINCEVVGQWATIYSVCSIWFNHIDMIIQFFKSKPFLSQAPILILATSHRRARSNAFEYMLSAPSLALCSYMNVRPGDRNLVSGQEAWVWWVLPGWRMVGLHPVSTTLSIV